MEQHKISQEDPADKHTFWKEHIEAWKASGLNQAQYCRSNNSRVQRQLYWKNKLEPTNNPRFLWFNSLFQRAGRYSSEVSSQKTPLRIAVCNKYCIEVDPGIYLLTFKQLLFALGQL